MIERRCIKLVSFLHSIFILATITAIFSITPVNGIPIEELDDQWITNVTEWTNRHIILTGNLFITHNGSLLIDNSTVEMNCSQDYEHIIKIDANGLLRIKNSNITSYNKYQSVGLTKNSQIILMANSSYPTERPNIQIDDSTFSYLGAQRYGTDDPDGSKNNYGVRIKRSGDISWIKGSTFQNMVDGVRIERLDAFVSVNDSSFINIGMNESGAQHVALGFYGSLSNHYLESETMYCHNNIFENIFNNKAYATPIYTHYIRNLSIDNTQIYNSSDGWYTIDVLSEDQHIDMKNIYAFNSKSITLNTFISDIHFENITWEKGGSVLFAFNSDISNITAKNLIITDCDVMGIPASTVFPEKYGGYAMSMSNISWTRSSAAKVGSTPISLKIKDSKISNVSMNGAADRVFIRLCDNIQSPLLTTNNIFQNFYIKGTSNGVVGYPNAMILIGDAVNNTFQDWNIINEGDGFDIYFSKDAYGNKWINTHFNENNIGFGTNTQFESYYYLDVLVKDYNGVPIPNANISVINEVSSNYLPVNINGETKTTFITEANGHLPLPYGNESNSVAVLDFFQTTDQKIQMSYTIDVSYQGYTSSISGVNPNCSWYRSNPNNFDNTIVITLPFNINDSPSPTASAGSDQTATVGVSITVDGSDSTDDNGIDSYVWDFGDNDDLQDTTGKVVSHIYNTAGTYTVTLTVTDTDGNTDIDTAIITVSASTTPTVNKDPELPEYWGYYNVSGTGNWGRTCDEECNGNYSAFLQGVEYSSADFLNIGLIAGDSDGYNGQNAYDINPSKVYNVSFNLKGNFNSVNVYALIWNSDYNYTGQSWIPTTIGQITPTSTWTQYYGNFTTPSDAEKCVLVFKINGSSSQINLGTIYVDDVEVSASPNIIQNPGAENDENLPDSNSIMYISPSTSFVAPGETFTIDVTVSPGEPIIGAQFDLNLDSSSLTVNSVTEGNLFSQEGASTYFSSGTIDNIAGTVTNVYGSILGGTNISSEGVLATITLTAGGTGGVSALGISNAIISDVNSNSALCTVTNATVRINSPPSVTSLEPAQGAVFDETDVINIDVTASDADEQSLSYTIKVDGVTRGTGSSYSWTTDYTSAGSHTIDVTVSDGISETTAQRTITVNNVHPRWDVNEDGTVDVLDLTTIGQQYGTSIEEPYPRWDINQDGVVNILDLTITSSHFGETGVE